MKTLHDLKALGYAVTLEGENIRLRYLGIGMHPVEAAPLIEALKVHKAEAVEYLKDTRPLPYLDADGSLVMPFSADPRYHYWRGGQSLVTTEEELKSWKH